MRLIQARVQCVDGVGDSGWFVPGYETTVIFGPPESGKAHLLQALQALNPLYDINQERPLAGYPDTWHQGEYTKKVVPEKKTAVFMVFSAEPEQVLELAKIGPEFFETDRIEVGRRLDYSRWTSFVEISASTRWSEIAEEMQELHSHVCGHTNLPEGAQQCSFFERMSPANRLTGVAAVECNRWLVAIAPFVEQKHNRKYQHCLHGVGRAERFIKAREMVADWLPLTLSLHPGYELQPSYSLADIFGGNWQKPDQPVLPLLRMLAEKFQLGDETGGQAKDVAAVMEDSATSTSFFQTLGLVLPVIKSDGQYLFFEGLQTRDILQRRLQVVGVICRLAELCHGRRPLLLLDRFERDLPRGQRSEMVKWLQLLGGRYQLLATTEDEAVAGADGWQAVRRTGPGGLAEAKLLSA